MQKKFAFQVLFLTVMTLDGSQVYMAVAEFENIYKSTPDDSKDPEDPKDSDDPKIPDVEPDPPVPPKDPDDDENPGTSDNRGFAIISIGAILGLLSIAIFKKKKA
ncbi:MAG: hypothetical protein IJE40_06425 [Clostridia bacterium]|nr:hypothetical protein [Clostridia bacterium]